MNRSLKFDLRTFFQPNSCIPRLDNYKYIEELLIKYIDIATSFSILCWQNEQDIIQLCEAYGDKSIDRDTLEYHFDGPYTKEFANILVNNIKFRNFCSFFTINLYYNGLLVFHSGNYGTETLLFDLSKEEIKDIAAWSKVYPYIKALDII